MELVDYGLFSVTFKGTTKLFAKTEKSAVNPMVALLYVISPAAFKFYSLPLSFYILAMMWFTMDLFGLH